MQPTTPPTTTETTRSGAAEQCSSEARAWLRQQVRWEGRLSQLRSGVLRPERSAGVRA